MKKLLKIFVICRKKKENFDSVGNIDKSVAYLNSRNIAFEYHNFEPDCHSNQKFSTASALEDDTGNFTCSSTRSIAPSRDVVAPFTLEAEKTEHCPNAAKLNSLSSDDTLTGGLVSQVHKQSLMKKSKPKGNVFVIQISNSRCFHIGPQKTVNVHETQPLKDSMRGSALDCTEEISLGSQMTMSKWWDSEEKLSDDYITLISVHLGKNWKDFGKYLGVEETALEDLEFRHRTDSTLIVHDMLHDYIIRYPNTSSGFVISALNEAHQVQVIEQLAQKENFLSLFGGFVRVSSKENYARHRNI